MTLICEDDRVILMNLAIYAMKMPQQDMVGEAENVGLGSDETVMDLVKAVRKDTD